MARGKKRPASEDGTDMRLPSPTKLARNILVFPQSEIGKPIDVNETIDSFGDLILPVGTPPRGYLASSRALARASPIFEAALFGPCKEPRSPSDRWVASQLDDGHEEMRLFLNICHGLPVPSTLGYSDFAGLVLLLEKYAAIHVIRPWIGCWRKSLVKQADKGLLPWVAWKLGDSKLLRESLVAIAECLEIDEDGHLVVDEDTEKLFSSFKKKDSNSPSDNLTEDELRSAIFDVRSALLNAEFYRYWDLIEELDDVEFLQDICVAGIVGKVFLGFKLCGIGMTGGLENAASKYCGTVKSLRDTMATKMSFEKIQHCNRCTDWLDRNLSEKVDNIQVQGGFITQSRRIWLDFRAVQTGLPRVDEVFWSRLEVKAPVRV